MGICTVLGQPETSDEGILSLSTYSVIPVRPTDCSVSRTRDKYLSLRSLPPVQARTTCGQRARIRESPRCHVTIARILPVFGELLPEFRLGIVKARQVDTRWLAS
jgi:hypothetical protein